MIKITADSTCDLSPELLNKYDVTLLHLGIVKDGEVFFDGVDISPEEIFRHVDRGGSICTTSAINVGTYMDFFSRFAAEYDAVIHINLGSEFSSCHQNACLAAKEFGNVYALDSANLSSGQGLLVLEAAEMAQSGATAQEICAKIENLRKRVETSFVLHRLDYMQKGGRCNSVTAFGANLLKLRICIEVKSGKMGVAKKYRGSFPSCISHYVTERLAGRTDIDPKRIMITHTCYDLDVTGEAREAIRENGNFAEICETRAGCTVACHCGPNCLGVLFIRKED